MIATGDATLFPQHARMGYEEGCTPMKRSSHRSLHGPSSEHCCRPMSYSPIVS